MAKKSAKSTKASTTKPAKNAAKDTAKSESKAKEPVNGKPKELSPFMKKQKQHLLELRDHILDAMAGMAQDNLRNRAEGSEASAFGMHQADAGSDAYDRDFALNLLSQEQDALYEIDEALKRIEDGTYGICEASGEKIPEARLEAIPFARLTVECQEKLEQQMGNMRGYQRPTRSLFGLMDGANGDGESVDSDAN